MSKKKLLTSVVILILTLTLVGSINTKKVFSTPDPTVFVDPQTSTAAPTQTFSVKVNVSDMTTQKSLFGWEFQMSYDSSILEVLDPLEEGPFLLQAGETFFIYDISTPGIIFAGNTFLPPPPSQGASGNGTLVVVSFRVKAEGSTALHFEYAYLLDKYAQNIPHTDFDGFFKYPIVHDIAVTSVFASPAQVTAGQPVTVNATVENEGDISETFNVKAYRNETLIETKQVTLAPGTSVNATFTWDTTIIVSGNYRIRAEVPPLLGETDTSDNTYTDGSVKVIVTPTASFTYTPNNPVVDEAITFDASASAANGGTIETFTWTFGDGNTTTVINPVVTHSYSASGAYTVVLNVTDSEGLWNTDSQLVMVGNPPHASFTFSPTTPQVDQLVTFNSTSYDPDGNIVSWKWDLNGDTIIDSTLENTTYTYTDSGTYTVTLNITDNSGLWNSTSKAVTIGKRSSSITINATPSVIKLEESTAITGSITPAMPDTVGAEAKIWYKKTTESTWVNLATVTTNSTSQYTYTWIPTAVGTYELKANWTGTSETQPAESTIATVTVNQPPQASFTYAPATPKVNDQVTFNASASTPNGGTIQTYAWDFGDQTNGAGVTVAHVFTTFGAFNVTLTITDTEGMSDLTWQLVTVLQAPNAIFTFEPEQILLGQTLVFDATESNDPDGTISVYTWDFGDGTSGAGQIAQHRYVKVGTYTVTLTVEDNDQLTGVATAYVLVRTHDIVVISVKPIPSMVIRGEQVTITVMVANKGDFNETFTLSLYYGTTLIANQEVALSAGTHKPIAFAWNTTNVTEGEMAIKAEAEVVPDETEIINNQLTSGSVTVQAEETLPSPPSPDILVYIIAAVAIVVIAAAGIYFIKSRK